MNGITAGQTQPLPIAFLQVDLSAAKRQLEDERNRGDARMRELEDKIRETITLRAPSTKLTSTSFHDGVVVVLFVHGNILYNLWSMGINFL